MEIMEHAWSLIGLYSVYLAAAVAPGQDFLAVSGCALGGSRRHGVLAALGVATGTAVWVAGALLGLTALLNESGALFLALKLAGGCYLVHLGLTILRGSSRRRPGSGASPLSVRTARRTFVIGLLANLSNPKTAIFFVGVLTVFLTPATPLWARIAGGAGMVAIAAVWYSAAACFLSQGWLRRLHDGGRSWIDRLLGAGLTGLGLHLIFGRP